MEQSGRSRIGAMFDRIAPSYDAMNHILSLGIDILWRRRLTGMIVSREPSSVLDLASGTGDVAVMTARKLPDVRILCADISEGMLSLARKKAAAAGLSDRMTFSIQDAARMDLESDGFDAVSVAFGIRNFADLGAGLSEMLRVLRPGGRAYLMEFSKPGCRLWTWVYGLYLKAVVGGLGGLISRQPAAYRYLVESIGSFSRTDVSAMMREAGFSHVSVRCLSGGIASIYTAVKDNN